MTDFTSTIAPVCAKALTVDVADACATSSVATSIKRTGDTYQISSEASYTWPASVTWDEAAQESEYITYVNFPGGKKNLRLAVAGGQSIASLNACDDAEKLKIDSSLGFKALV